MPEPIPFAVAKSMSAFGGLLMQGNQGAGMIDSEVPRPRVWAAKTNGGPIARMSLDATDLDEETAAPRSATKTAACSTRGSSR